ncbi:MAG: hypothetical protein KDA93_16445 [Planctomycetaceae bacterium]|nr:hypothetical protein [Planctomycetaceae bacterium]
MNLDANLDRELASDVPAWQPGGLVWGVLLLAAIARVSVLWGWSDNLSDDRDVYLAIAEGVAEGRGYSVHGTNIPTAFRPPLYPVMLAVTGTSRSPFGRALLHLVLGVGTVWLTVVIACRFGLSRRLALFAGAIVAVDPLLLRYTTFPMTETLATFLATALLGCLTMPSSRHQQLLTGFVFGLNVLCRPTVWVFAGLMGLWWISRRLVSMRESQPSEPLSFPWLTMAAGLLTVLPWVVRNTIVMGHPILMTTHGGYTLLLGNNPRFYEEVVNQPWGTVWDGSHGAGQEVWVEEVNRQMDEAGVTGEVDRDRWLGQRARETMQEQPGMFVRACLLRLRRFWSLAPQGEAGAAIPSQLRLPVITFYGGIFLLAAVGLIRIFIPRPSCFQLTQWLPVVLLIATFVSVHLVYWSNARMRSPVVPAIALLAARSVSRRRE